MAKYDDAEVLVCLKYMADLSVDAEPCNFWTLESRQRRHVRVLAVFFTRLSWL